MQAVEQLGSNRANRSGTSLTELDFADALTMRGQNGRAAYLLALVAAWFERAPLVAPPSDWRLVAKRAAAALQPGR